MPSKAWREQFHRIIAGSLLGVLVLALALLATRRRPQGWLQVIGAGGAGGHRDPAVHARPARRGVRAGDRRRNRLLLAGRCAGPTPTSARTSTLTLAVIIFQALLGMWTVTWLLKPVVVMGHLLGGLDHVLAC